jgi:hypothetical protein
MSPPSFQCEARAAVFLSPGSVAAVVSAIRMISRRNNSCKMIVAATK